SSARRREAADPAFDLALMPGAAEAKATSRADTAILPTSTLQRHLAARERRSSNEESAALRPPLACAGEVPNRVTETRPRACRNPGSLPTSQHPGFSRKGIKRRSFRNFAASHLFRSCWTPPTIRTTHGPRLPSAPVVVA